MPQTTDQLKPCPLCGASEFLSMEMEPASETNDGAGKITVCRDHWHIVCNAIVGGCGCSGPSCGSEATTVRAWNRRAVPLVAEAPREPVAWMNRRTGHVTVCEPGHVYAFEVWAKSEIPLYAALPASLAPMPEEWLTDDEFLSSLDSNGIACEPEAALAIKELLESHLRTAPRPTLSDEQITEFAMAHNLHHAEPDQRDAIHPFARALLAASASPQQPEQKTDFHLAAPLESAVQGLDAAAGVTKVAQTQPTEGWNWLRNRTTGETFIAWFWRAGPHKEWFWTVLAPTWLGNPWSEFPENRESDALGPVAPPAGASQSDSETDRAAMTSTTAKE
jgi:hypothetical protein